jgi:hypothetical protein
MLSASYVSASFEKGKGLEFEDYMTNAAASYHTVVKAIIKDICGKKKYT